MASHTRPFVLVGLLVLVWASSGFGLKAIGPYPMQICIDITDYLFVGVVVSTDDFDPDTARRVSHIEVRRCLHGDVAAGDTLAVEWSTGRGVQADGSILSISPQGPQLSEISGLHLWSISEDERGMWCAYDPITVGSSASARSEMRQQLEWARHERIPYGGAMADPERRRAKGIDLAAGDSLRAVLAAYLAERLAATDEAQY